MPLSGCCVPLCSNRGGHVFPKNEQTRKQWLHAIRRQDFRPTKSSVVCKKHFTASDYILETCGNIPLVNRLKQGVVPNNFTWSSPPNDKAEPWSQESKLLRTQIWDIQRIVEPTDESLPLPLKIKDEPHVVLSKASIDDLNSLDFPEVKVSNHLITPNDLTLFKQEVTETEYIVPKAEVLSDNCDLPTFKSDIDNFKVSCSSDEQYQDTLETSEQNVSKVCHTNNPSSHSNQKHLGQRIHTADKPFKCEICLKRFKTINFLNNHIKLHSENPITCEICLRQFSQKKYLNFHLKKHPRIIPFKCGICSKQFIHQNYLNIHVKLIHKGEKPFKCEICLKQFKSKNFLNNHIRLHSEKPIKCEICLQQFTQKKYLNFHLKTHSDVKPFKCKICSKEFIHQNYLKIHVNIIHKGEKPFKCDICLKQFSIKLNLASHLTVHSEEKPFKCEICSNQFKQLSHLKNHVKFHN